MSTMPLPVTGYLDCEWPLDPACLGDVWDTFDTATRARATALAGATLRRLTGYRVGGCPVVVRPCKRSCMTGLAANTSFYGGSSFAPYLDQSANWINSCGCATDCSCGSICEIALPAPVGAVYSVQLNGTTLPTTDYRLMGNRLVYTGAGACAWPTCQDMAAPLTAANTFGVTYLNAYPVDALGAWAAGILAVEYGKACAGGTCRLPANVTRVTRQGVSFDIQGGAFPNGFVGIREIDSYIALWNPNGLRQQSSVWTPGRRVRSER